ncbi:hypothetical protein BZG36_05287 [Bifiguratus adelaidae]|uniref:Uncharacterized protein n=1 Tax=Bifiguratus adelaidae TaxID=1938954 RepID=A0A261XV37_9FUNG|nr:hypothetical protein BZG36_05287 [Bifiguratus adelaidae]
MEGIQDPDGDDGPDRNLGYLKIVSNLDKYFYNHLKNVKVFSLTAAGDVPLALNRSQMPLFRTAHFATMHVCAEMADVLAGHPLRSKESAYMTASAKWPKWTKLFLGRSVSNRGAEQTKSPETSGSGDDEIDIYVELEEEDGMRRIFLSVKIAKYGEPYENLKQNARRDFPAAAQMPGFDELGERAEFRRLGPRRDVAIL